VSRLERCSHVGFLGVAFGWQKGTRRFCFTLWRGDRLHLFGLHLGLFLTWPKKCTAPGQLCGVIEIKLVRSVTEIQFEHAGLLL
jgi:hypothetical protein